MHPTIFITGGSGLLALNWALSVRDRFTVVLGLHERNIELAGVRTMKINLDSKNSLMRSLVAVQPKIVVHAAGLTSVEQCEANPSLAEYINVDLAENVARTCAELGVQLVHISTDHFFSGDYSLVDESCPVAPVNVYGWTKAEAEVRVLKANPTALVIRTNFYGWGTSYRYSFSDFIIRALKAGKGMTLFQDVFYTPILIEAGASAVHELVKLNASGIFHIVGDERISKYEFGIRIAERCGLDVALLNPGYLKNHASLVQRPRDMSLSNKKARDMLGRRLGGVSEHLARLFDQNKAGLAKELQNL